MGYTANGDLADLFQEEPMVRAAERTARRVGDDLRERVRRHTPVAKPPPGAGGGEWELARHRVPGTLRESWKVGEVVITQGGARMSIDVFTHDPVAPDVEWDTKPHEIRAHDGGVLRYWDRHGGMVFATIVHHPGTKGVHMLATSLVEVAVSWQRIGAEEMARWAREAFA